METDHFELEREEKLRQKRKKNAKRKRKKNRKSSKLHRNKKYSNVLSDICNELFIFSKRNIKEETVQVMLRFIAAIVTLAVMWSLFSEYTTNGRVEQLQEKHHIKINAGSTATEKASDPFGGWRKVVRKTDDGTYEDYFFNRITGERSATVPLEMVDGEIRNNWQRFFDKETESFFYRNVDTGMVTWSAPPSFDDDHSIISIFRTKSGLRGSKGSAKSKSKTGMSVSKVSDPGNISISGWRRVATPKEYLEEHPLSAKFYFVHEPTKETAWNPPAAWRLNYTASSDASNNADKAFQTNGATTLHGWQRHWDKTRREYFYSDVSTGETTWKPPNNEWRKILLREQFCDLPKVRDGQNEGPIFQKHDKYVLLEYFQIKEADLTEGNSESPEECCRFCELEKLCFGFVHTGKICHLKREGGEVEMSLSSKGTHHSTIGIRIKPGSIASDLDRDGKLQEQVKGGVFVLY